MVISLDGQSVKLPSSVMFAIFVAIGVIPQNYSAKAMVTADAQGGRSPEWLLAQVESDWGALPAA
jgi:hypothetical protein